ncbi:MAG: hypothetical protein A2020_13910 [Lentisphaerae bacterium GWF2_45_14]|nr:MAG: hypothetical protein A2020_13910 [Lentisphaerae bacterium GWF2_45_14]
MFTNPLTAEAYTERLKEKKADYRGDFFRDQTAIIHSLPFRRLKHKTQVFFAPDNDHICTRIEHVLHVATIAATICKGLNSTENWQLNTEMAFAIGLGHDIGHAPFGHSGEKALNEIFQADVFKHEIHGLRVADQLAYDGLGLNLTFGVRDGIICHCGESDENGIAPRLEKYQLSNINSRGSLPASYEGCIARFADKIAYLGRDIEDAVTAGLIRLGDIPSTIRKELGSSNGEIINTLVNNMIENSAPGPAIRFSGEKHDLLLSLKKFNYDNIYKNPRIISYENYCVKIIKAIYAHLMNENDGELKLDRHFSEYRKKMKGLYDSENAKLERIACDYIAGMTDSYALDCMKQISLPLPIEFR